MLSVYPENFTMYTNAIESENCLDKKGLVNNWSSGSIDPTLAAQFTKYMHSSHSSSANGFAKRINLKEKFGVDSFLDVGGGSGCFWIEVFSFIIIFDF